MSMVNVNMSVADNVKTKALKKTNILCQPEKIIAYYYRIIIQLNT